MARLRSRPAFLAALAVLGAALPLSLLAAVCLGTNALPVGQVYTVLRYELAYRLAGVPIPEGWGPSTPLHDVVWLIRLPRLVLAAAVGTCLALSGAVMQALVQNPLADPYVLGISSGASLGATLALLVGAGAGLGGGFVGGMAFVGALGASFAVIALANLGGRANTVKLLLAGSALAAVCGAFSSFLIYRADADRAASQVARWTMGSMAAASWPSNGVLVLAALLGTAFFLTRSRALNLMLLGDDTALTLGTDLHRLRMVCLAVTALMTGLAVWAAGIIGFVGLVVPHGVRLLFGADHRRLVPLAALAGGLFLLWADVLCRVVLPGNELPIGVLTSMLGAPVFLYLMARSKYGFGGGAS